MHREIFELKRLPGMTVTDAELLADLVSTARATGRKTVGQKEYRREGRYDDSTVTHRFGS